jgi:VIT family
VANTPTLKRSFVEKFIAPASSLAEVFFGLIMVLTFTLGAGLADITTADERSRFYRSILALAGRRPVTRTKLERSDIYGGIACAVLVFLTALPAAVPFMLIDDARLALRVSNGLLVAMLFGVGYIWARHTNANRVLTGLAMMLVGVLLVGAAMALGG